MKNTVRSAHLVNDVEVGLEDTGAVRQLARAGIHLAIFALWRTTHVIRLKCRQVSTACSLHQKQRVWILVLLYYKKCAFAPPTA